MTESKETYYCAKRDLLRGDVHRAGASVCFVSIIAFLLEFFLITGNYGVTCIAKALPYCISLVSLQLGTKMFHFHFLVLFPITFIYNCITLQPGASADDNSGLSAETGTNSQK